MPYITYRHTTLLSLAMCYVAVLPLWSEKQEQLEASRSSIRLCGDVGCILEGSIKQQTLLICCICRIACGQRAV